MIIPNNRISRIVFKNDYLPLEIKIPSFKIPEIPEFLKKERTFISFLFIISIVTRFYMLGVLPDLNSQPCEEEDSLWQGYSNVISIVQGKPFSDLIQGSHATALYAYFVLPFFLFLSNFRLLGVIADIVSIFLIYSFCKDFFEERTARIASVLYLFSTFFIIQSRVPNDRYTLQHFLLILIIIFFYKWYKSDSKIQLAIPALLLGIGLSIQMSFAYVIASFLLAFLIFRRIKFGLRKSHYLVFGFFFFLGAIPFLQFILTQVSLVSDISINFPITEYDYNNLDILNNIWLELKYTHQSLDIVFELNENYPNSTFLPSFTFILFSISVPYFLLNKRKREIFLILIVIATIYLGIFTLTIYGKIIMVFPFVYVVISRFLSLMTKKNRLILLLLIALVAINLVNLVFYLLSPLLGYFPQYVQSRYGITSLVDFVRNTQISRLYVLHYYHTANYHAGDYFSVEKLETYLSELNQSAIDQFKSGEIGIVIPLPIELRLDVADMESYNLLIDIFIQNNVTYDSIYFYDVNEKPLYVLFVSSFAE